MPPHEDKLERETVIDISHESLMRVWERLKTWADEEAKSAQIYSRLAETAVLHGAGQAGLWQDPDLQVALQWQEQNQPNEVWARRYHPEFTKAMAFLKKSSVARGRRRWTVAGITLFVFVVLTGFLVYALLAKRDVTQQTIIAEAVGAKDLIDSRPTEGLIAAIVSSEDARQAFPADKIPTEIRASVIEALDMLREGGVPRNSWVAHGGEVVTSIDMSDDGQTIVTGGWDAKVRRWDKEGKPIGEPLAKHTLGITSVAISPDGRTLVSAGYDAIRIWSQNGDEATLKKGEFSNVDVTSDGQTIVLAGGFDGFVMKRTGEMLNSKTFGEDPENWPVISISADGQTILRSELGRVRLSDGKGEDIWKRDTDQGKREDRDRSEGATTATLSRDGQTIVIGYQNGFIRLWSRNGKPLVDEPEEGQSHDGRVTCVAISVDGQTIVSGGEEGTVRLWDRKAKPNGTPLRGHAGNINAVAVSANGKSIVSAGDDGMVRLWERPTPREPVKLYEGQVDSTSFSRNGEMILAAGPGARILSWKSDRNPTGDTSGSPIDMQATATAWGPGGEFLVIGRSDGKLVVRDQQGTEKSFSHAHEGPVTSIAVSGDGKIIVTGDQKGNVRLWDREGKPVGQPSRAHEGAVASVGINWDGQTIVSGGSDGKVLRWNQQGSVISPPLITSYSTGTGETVAVSPDGKYIVSGSERGMMRLWAAQASRVFKGHETNVRCLAFSSDSKMILSGADDGTVRLWDLHGQPIGHQFRGPAAITTVALSPDKNILVSGDQSGNVTVRQIGIEPFLRDACDWLRYHRALISPETEKEKRAAEIARSLFKT
jgi:WD40 repeat protein